MPSDKVPDYRENLNPVCDICFGAHKTSKHEEIIPKVNLEKEPIIKQEKIRENNNLK